MHLSPAVCARGVLVLLLAFVASGCAARVVPATEATEIAIRVENDLVPPRAVTVYLVPEQGDRRTLGTVSASDTATFDLDPATIVGRFRLAAAAPGGDEILSDAVNIVGRPSIAWGLQNNILAVAPREPELPRPPR